MVSKWSRAYQVLEQLYQTKLADRDPSMPLKESLQRNLLSPIGLLRELTASQSPCPLEHKSAD